MWRAGGCFHFFLSLFTLYLPGNTLLQIHCVGWGKRIEETGHQSGVRGGHSFIYSRLTISPLPPPSYLTEGRARHG